MGAVAGPGREGTLSELQMQVLDEIHRRAGFSGPLSPCANGHDWLPTAAERCFGSWCAAVEAAGHSYAGARPPELTPDEVLSRIAHGACQVVVAVPVSERRWPVTPERARGLMPVRMRPRNAYEKPHDVARAAVQHQA